MLERNHVHRHITKDLDMYSKHCIEIFLNSHSRLCFKELETRKEQNPIVHEQDFTLCSERKFKGTVAPVLSRLKVVWINTVESGEVPLVVYRFFKNFP